MKSIRSCGTNANDKTLENIGILYSVTCTRCKRIRTIARELLVYSGATSVTNKSIAIVYLEIVSDRNLDLKRFLRWYMDGSPRARETEEPSVARDRTSARSSRYSWRLPGRVPLMLLKLHSITLSALGLTLKTLEKSSPVTRVSA